MTPLRRWLLVAALVAVCASLPSLVAALPVRSDGRTAAELRAAIVASAEHPYSGYAESSGGLALPVTGELSSVSSLLGDKSQIRVWYGGPSDWRVDRLSLAGESDTYQSPDATTIWNYEEHRADIMLAGSTATVRLPVISDLTPPELGRRLLSQASADELRRLPAREIAGRKAQGLRLVPSEPGSTVRAVDIWADASGVPLRVDVIGAGSATPALTSTFLDFSDRMPAATVTQFVPPLGAKISTSDPNDLTDAINRFGGPLPPDRLAGATRNPALPVIGAVGTYGRGVTEFVVAPLFRRDAAGLRYQLAKTLGVQLTQHGEQVSVGPVSLLITNPDSAGRSWLLAGTVDGALMDRAAADLAASVAGGGR